MTTIASPRSQASSARPVLAALAGTVLLAAATPVLAMLPREDEPVAILSAQADAPALLAAIGEAGGRVTSLAGRHVTVAVSGDPRFLPRLREQGYWLLLDARTLAACLPALQTTQRS